MLQRYVKTIKSNTLSPTKEHALSAFNSKCASRLCDSSRARISHHTRALMTILTIYTHIYEFKKNKYKIHRKSTHTHPLVLYAHKTRTAYNSCGSEIQSSIAFCLVWLMVAWFANRPLLIFFKRARRCPTSSSTRPNTQQPGMCAAC